MMPEDPIVAEVQRTRECLAARFEFDVHAIFADLRARQVSVGDRLVSPKCREAEHSLAVDRVTEPVPDR